jgi:predicted protein tyrosine phosphatase/anti-anti-sigma regulatory factor
MNIEPQQTVEVRHIASGNPDILFLRISGVLDKASKEGFLSEIRKHLNVSAKRVILEASDLAYLSPSGIEALDSLPRVSIGRWAEIHVVNLTEPCERQIRRYGINHKIVFQDDKTSAGGSVFSAPVQVYAENELIQYVKEEKIPKGYACVSIRNPDEEMPAEIADYFEHICELKFYDAYDIGHLGPEQKIKRIPESGDIQLVMDFFAKLKDTVPGFIVHCWHGHSRSPAVALGLLYLMFHDENKAKSELHRIRPAARPHMLMVKFFDTILGSDLLPKAREIRSEALERIKREIDGLDEA